MSEEFVRTEMLLGKENVARLRNASVILFGVGGVGSFAAEALARGGVGRIALVDHDTVCPSNINRQLIALHSTVGRQKAEVMGERIKDICPETVTEIFPCFYNAETAGQFELGKYDYIIDAIDTVSSKLLLIEEAQKAGTPVISAMGAGNKLEPTRFEVADIFQTSVCPLAKVMRRELRGRGIRQLKVVYSKEEPISPESMNEEESGSVRRQTPGSISFVPSVAGLILAGEVIKDLIKMGEKP